jgi:putative hemolysin
MNKPHKRRNSNGGLMKNLSDIGSRRQQVIGNDTWSTICLEEGIIQFSLSRQLLALSSSQNIMSTRHRFLFVQLIGLFLCFMGWQAWAEDLRLAMANPASAACTQAGGQLSTLQTAQGETKLCTLPSGLVCEEWAFFKGTCGRDTPPIDNKQSRQAPAQPATKGSDRP